MHSRITLEVGIDTCIELNNLDSTLEPSVMFVYWNIKPHPPGQTSDQQKWSNFYILVMFGTNTSKQLVQSLCVGRMKCMMSLEAWEIETHVCIFNHIFIEIVHNEGRSALGATGVCSGFFDWERQQNGRYPLICKRKGKRPISSQTEVEL